MNFVFHWDAWLSALIVFWRIRTFHFSLIIVIICYLITCITIDVIIIIKLLIIIVIIIIIIITSPRNRGGVIFSLQFVCVSVCLSVCVCVCVCVQLFSCEQNSSRTDAPIWTRFSLNGCLYHLLGPYWIWWPWVKGQGHGDRKCM